MVDRFTTMLDCVELGFLPDGILDQLPAPSQVAGTRVGGINMNIPRFVPPSPRRSRWRSPRKGSPPPSSPPSAGDDRTDPDDYSTRQGAYDLRKLRGKQLVIKPGRARRYHVPGDAARTITALLTVRDKVIAPLLAGIRTPRRGRPPQSWTQIDRDYETIRLHMQTLFNHLGISLKPPAVSTTSCRSLRPSL